MSIRHSESLFTRIMNHVFLVLGSFLAVGPFIWMFLTSIKTFEETIQIPVKFLPDIPRWKTMPSSPIS